MPLTTPFNKGALEKIIAQMFKRYKTTETSIFLDKLKDLGFKYSTFSGITIAASDVVVSKNKHAVIEKSNEEIKKVNKQFQRGLITDRERLDLVIDIWSKAKEEIQDELQGYAKSYVDNPIFIMMNSKARGSISNFVQLAGMRGLMAKPNGETIEIPILSNFSEGLSVSEFFLSTHSARKGSADTALKTADSGYMTRRLVDVSQDVIVKEEDCGTDFGVTVSTFINDKDNTVIEGLYDRIVGRFASKKVINPETKEVIVDKDEMITEKIADKIVKAGIEKVEIRNILTCETVNGVCQKCYGRNLATGNVVEIGEAVGIMAAQSIGEPGTQLTMRTFHTGGVAGDDITQGLPRVEELFEARKPKGQAIIAEAAGAVQIQDIKNRKEITITEDNGEAKVYAVPYGARLKVNSGDVVEAGQELTEGSINPHDLLRVKGPLGVQMYLIREVQKVYRLQGVDINDKHIEVMVRQMLRKVKIEDPGDTNLLPGGQVDVFDYESENERVRAEGGQEAIGKTVLLGITKASLATDSFLSAASFQETTRVLTDAAIKGKVDPLLGLKENVILGKLIPVGTGMRRYRGIKVSDGEETPDFILE